MKRGLIFDMRRYSVHDGPGIRTSVFLKGCPLRCNWCHNPEGILPGPRKIRKERSVDGRKNMVEETIGKWMSSQEVLDFLLKDLVFYEESGGGITFTGGEPLFQPDFLLDMLLECKNRNLHTAVDTSGYAPSEVFQAISGRADLLLFDLKTVKQEKHLAYTGRGTHQILRNLYSLKKNRPELIIRIPVIPGFNDQLSEMEALCETLSRVDVPIKRVDFLPCHNWGRHKYEALGMEPPEGLPGKLPEEILYKFMEVFSDAGYGVKKGG